MDKNKKRAVAVLECYEEIPCNPCMHSCPHEAIRIEGGIHHIPVLDEAKCVGCGICITHCSGQAIFLEEVTEDDGYVSVPYEFVPLPVKGMKVGATGREGQYICEGEIADVRSAKAFDHTSVVKIKIPKRYVNDVRGFQYMEERNEG